MATIDFQDWELLHSASDSDSDSAHSIHSAAFIHLNHFSSDAHNPFQEDDKSAPDFDYHTENNPTLLDLSFDSTSDRSDDRKFGQMEEIKEIIFSQDQNKKVKMLEEEEAEDLGKLYLDSSRVEIISPEHGVVAGEVDSHDEPEVPRAENNEIESIGCGGEVIEESKENSQLKKRSVMWWKMPVEFLKYCVFRMTPLCAISIAAAAMLGFSILGRRLYKMKKKKTKGLEIKVTVDDKKISQVMSRVGRLNEAFLIVKRVPAIRPLLGGVGSINIWPAMSLR